MSYVTDYNSLTAELQALTEDDSAEFVAEMDNIIQRGMDTVQRLLDLDFWRGTILTSLAPKSRLFSRPDCLKVKSIFLSGVGDFLQRRSYDWCRSYQGLGQPLYWCEQSQSNIYLTPTPDQNYNVEIDSLVRLPSLNSTTATTNWITANAGDLLLLACLIEAEGFLKAPERVAEYAQELQTKAALLGEKLRGTERPDYTPLSGVAAVGS